jgi:GNAT superfamily N-acetyltransferase
MVAMEVRAAREEDLADIVTWTTATFEWGDYVPDRLPSWLSDPDSVVLVRVDESDRPLAVCHAVMLSGYEGWLEAARVHPAHRRAGLGSALNRAGADWLAGRGAQVVRLAIEATNSSARSQVEKLGYRPVSSWCHGGLEVDATTRCPASYRLHPTPPGEIDAAWVFWANGDLAVGGRELMARGWQWRRTRPDDLVQAATEGLLHQSPAGWVIVEASPRGWLQTGWLAADPEDAPRLYEGLIDLAVDRAAEGVEVKVPGVPWVVEALTRAGGRPKEVVIYARVP